MPLARVVLLSSSLCLLLFVSFLDGQTGPDAERVGEYGYPDRLVVEGSKTFTPGQIRSGLNGSPSYMLASHPSAPLDEFLQVLADSIREGYLHAGFPEVRVRVEHDDKTRKVGARVEEGRRYTAGAIHCTGGSEEHTARIVEMLSTVSARSPEEVLAGIKKPAFKERAAWIPETPAHFDRAAEAFYTKAVREAYARLGHLHPRVNARVVPDTGGNTARLEVRIDDEGPACRIGPILVLGTRRNSPEEVRGYLGIRTGDPLNQDLLDRIRLALWRSGRFLSSKVEWQPPLPGVVGHRLIITLHEYDEVPPLSGPLTPIQTSLLQLGGHIASSLTGTGELEITFSLPETSGGMVWSPRKGILARVRTTALPGRVFHELVLALVPGRIVIGAATDQRARRTLAVDTEQELTLMVHLTPDPEAAQSERPFHLRTAVGFRTPIPERKEPIDLDLRLDPVVFLSLARYPTRIENGVAIIRAGATTLKINPATGEPISFEFAPPGDKSPSVRVEPRSGVFDERLRALVAPADPTATTTSYGPFVTGVVGLLIEDVLVPALAGKRGAADGIEPLVSAWRKLATRHLAPALEQWGTVSEAPVDEKFVIPGASHDASSLGPMAALGFMFAKFATPRLPPGTWPWTVVRETAFVLMNRQKHLRHELVRLYRSEDIGPIAYLTGATLLGLVDRERAGILARRGLERLTTADFRNDLAPFRPSPGNRLARFAAQVLRGLRDLDDAEIDAVAGVLGPKDGPFFARAVRAVQKAEKDQPPLDVLAPILDEYWEAVLRARVEAALRRLEP